MSFPACKHRKKSAPPEGWLTWLASEPFRLFFFSGALWSIIGVSLWPLYYAGKISFYPGITHARLMIETFGGAFVVGFLGTAGPRMASAPKLTGIELILLFALHTATGVLHLLLMISEADQCFLALLILLLLCLSVRLVRYRKESPPPQLLLALTGLLCGIAGATMWQFPEHLVEMPAYRLAGLLVYQGLLLPPVLGIGSFIFPRILGGDFGEATSPRQQKAKLCRALLAAMAIVGSFFIEITGYEKTAFLVRAGTAVLYLLIEVRWRKMDAAAPRGSLATGLYWALITGLVGLALAGFFYDHHVAVEHLLYIGCFGLLILIVASRVLFGHSGDLDGFSNRSWMARTLIAFAFIAATTRASADFWPKITISHHKYAAWTWGLTALLWILWHRKRFLKK